MGLKTRHDNFGPARIVCCNGCSDTGRACLVRLHPANHAVSRQFGRPPISSCINAFMRENHKNGPVAVVTGSGRDRVGGVIARELADDGYRIALHYHSSQDAAEEKRDALRERGIDCHAFQADVSEEADVRRFARGVMEQFGRVDVVVTTSSTWLAKSLEETTAEDCLNSFRVNSLGTFLVAREFGLRMTEQSSGGSIVTIGDTSIGRPYIDHAAYFIAKGSLPTLTRMLAVELGHRNPKVRVNCLEPGPIMFPPGTDEDEKEQLRNSTLVKDADCPSFMTDAVRFLISNRFITGACLPIDGGQHCYTPEGATRR